MPYTLNQSQQMFVEAYRERFQIGDDYTAEIADEIVVNRAISALAATESKNQADELKEHQINEAVDAWCKKYQIQRNGSHLLRDKIGWLICDEFSIDDPGSDVFPALFTSFKEYLKAHGFRVDERSYGVYSITDFQFET